MNRNTSWPLAALVLAGHPALAQSRLADLHRMVPFNEQSSWVVLADVDGDGLPEAIQGRNPLRLLRTDGDGRFVEEEGVFPPLVAEQPTVADLDGDGDLDMIVGALPGDVVFLGDGTGAFQELSGSLPPGKRGTMHLGDLDGDGDVDVAATRDGRILWNDGTAHFTLGAEVNAGNGDIETDIEITDVDGDGDQDIVLANLSSPGRVHLNDGTGGFSELPGAIPVGGSYLAAGDLDGDGDPDLVLEPGTLLLNDGDGVFAEQPGVIPPAARGSVILLLDYDLDGDLDIFLASEELSLMVGDGAGGFTYAPELVPPSRSQRLAHFLAAADVDEDGDLDLWMGGGGNGILVGPPSPGASDRLFLGDGHGGFVLSEVHFPTEGLRPAAVATGDFDGDGRTDAVAENALGSTPLLWLGDGAGGFVDASEGIPDLGYRETMDYATADVDGDGDLDLLVLALLTPRLLLNQGDATFADGGSPLSNLDTPMDVDLADMDANGTSDAVLAKFGAPNEVWSNDGVGVFSLLPNALGSVSRFTFNIEVGDVDGDGLSEIFAANASPNGNKLFRNLGGGAFLDVSAALPAGSDHGGDAVIRDFDGDGDGDIFVTRFDMAFMTLLMEQNHLYLFEDGAFVDATAALPQELTGGTAIAAEDYDQDGDVDLLVANSIDFGSVQFALEPDYFENQGGAVFTRPAKAIPCAVPEALATADFDGDGDLDVFGGRWVWTNVTHQLSWRALPRLGKELTFDLRGPAGAPWLLVGSLGRLRVPLAAGTLWIVPSLIVVRTVGALDGAGQGSASFSIPPDPTLLGLASYWQALFGPTPLLSNLEIAVLTNG